MARVEPKHFRSLAQISTTKISAPTSLNAMRWAHVLTFCTRCKCCNLMYWLSQPVWSASFNGMLRKLNEWNRDFFLGCCYNRLMINIVTSGWIPCEWNCNAFVFFSIWPSPIQTTCHTRTHSHISSIYSVVTFYFHFMNERISYRPLSTTWP